MVESLATISEGRYTYINDTNKGPPDAIDIHHIIISRSSALGYIFYIFILLSATFCFLLLPQDLSMAILFSFSLAVCLVKSWQGKQVEKESVTILPAFGVQLETTYRSGRTVRCFVPISKILKPVLNECVTPVTCYWSLSLIIREEELLLVFKELHPPITMLVPIWKALCAAILIEEFSDVH
ncbi:GPI- c transferase complex, PIG-H component [Olea europaea subsp. europaea]|uniref:GPI- c transferase complex, PIG-H component n=1 Tax=Olea europaea subsp. europaea TaxID=158383 RepID=A0A8S0VDR1_OLEEU|nr:GPI- c transferase complex, PIG-H component [Olea europaea subsp. europaea]